MPPKKIEESHKQNVLFRSTIKQIHEAILTCGEDKKKLARFLNVSDIVTVPTHLGKFLFNGLPLTIYQLNALSVEEASAQMGSNYDTKLDEIQPNVEAYPVNYLHYVCSITERIRSAAILLGLRDHTIQRYLSQFTYNGIPLKFDAFRQVSPDEATACLRNKNPVKIGKKPKWFEKTLSHERFNLTPEIPENKAGLADMGNPIFFCKIPLKKSDYVLTAWRSDEDESNQPEPSVVLPSNDKPSKKRKIPARSATEDAGLSPHRLVSTLSMFVRKKKHVISNYNFRRQPTLARDPDFVYDRLKVVLDHPAFEPAQAAVPVLDEVGVGNLLALSDRSPMEPFLPPENCFDFDLSDDLFQKSERILFPAYPVTVQKH